MADPDIGGGNYVILQHALFLRSRGHRVDLVCHTRTIGPGGIWHEGLDVLPVVSTRKASQHYDVAILTWWNTAFDVGRVSADHYVYFVQSIESRFYPPEEYPIRKLVEATYQLGLPTITEVSWIRSYLLENYNRDSYLVRNGIRKDLYHQFGPEVEPRSTRVRVLVEGPLGIHHKNTEKALELASLSRVGEVWLLTLTDVRGRVPGADRVFSRVPIHEVPAIMRSCDVLVKLSRVEGMFGPPLEMFHCGGTAVTYEVTGSDEYLKDGINAFVLPMDDETGVVTRLDQLVEQPRLMHDLRAEALRTAEGWPDWDASSSEFAESLEAAVQAEPPIRASLVSQLGAARATYAREERVRLAGFGRGAVVRFTASNAVARLPYAVRRPLLAAGGKSMRSRPGLPV